MSFVQKLRMNNIFPTGGMNLGFSGQLPQFGGADPLREILNLYDSRSHNAYDNSSSNSGGRLRQVANKNVAAPSESLRFGGVVNSPGSNPGGDILARSAKSAEQTYANYGQPQVTAGEMLKKAGIKPNEQFPHYGDSLDIDKQLDRERKKQQIESSRVTTDAKGWKTVTITDPNDPSKQINVRHNDGTGEVQPITMPNNGLITPATSPVNMQKKIDADNAKAKQQENIKTKAQEALDVLDRLSDRETGKLKPNTEWVTGLSANFGTKYTPKGASAVADIDRLRNILTLDLIGEMKAQSKTGATGFGALNLKELGVLENAASKLDARNMDEDEYAIELSRIRKQLDLMLQSPNTTDIKPVVSHDNTQTPKAPEGFEYVRRPDNKGWTAIRKVGQ